MMFQNTTEVRESLERYLRRDIAQGIWEYLEKRNYIQEVIDGYIDIDGLAEEYKSIQQAGDDARDGERNKRTQHVRELQPDSRSEVLQALMAKEADRRPEVVAFRSEVLRGAGLGSY